MGIGNGNIKRKLGILLVAAAAVALGVSGITGTARANQARADQERAEHEGPGLAAPIEGSWIFAVTRINNLPASFTAIGSFTAGGVFLATGSNDRLSVPGPVSPLYGSWKRTEHNRYISTTQFFAFNPVTGEAVAMLKAVQTFKLTSDQELVGVGEAWACDVQGQNCERAPIADITVEGTRIIPQDVTELTLPME
jgi:hypothetical protein